MPSKSIATATPRLRAPPPDSIDWVFDYYTNNNNNTTATLDHRSHDTDHAIHIKLRPFID